jgi:hypothetical protein
MKSMDCGKTWNQNITLATSSDLARLPDIGFSENNVHVVWGDELGWNGIYYRNSTDNGETWNPVKRISSEGVDAFAPKIYINNSTIHIIWLDERNGSDYEIYYRRSLDGGITWDDGQGVNQDKRITFSSPAVLGSPSIDGDESNISILWTDESDGDLDKYWMISKDNGATWEDGLGTPNVGRNLSDNTLDSGSGSITINNSNLHVVWYEEEWPGPVYRLYYRDSTNNGVSWNSVQILSGPTSGINDPAVDVYGDEVCVIWGDKRDDNTTAEIYYKYSTNGGVSWSEDIRLTYNETYDSIMPKIAINGTTKHVVWRDQRDGNNEIYYKRYPDFPADTTPPDVSYVTPPTPPDNSTYAVGQKAFARVHYYDNESASSNATLFWKNSTGTWNWKPMDNISYWSGSHNNYFEANFTEDSPTTVIYYVNCTSAAGLTTTTPPRTLNFDNGTIHDPYPIYGFVRLYDGNGGAYTPIPLANAPIEVTWWDISLNNWNTISANADVNGQYTVDLMNYMNEP